MTTADLLENTACRVQFLADMFSAANPEALTLSEGGATGLVMILNDIACDLTTAHGQSVNPCTRALSRVV